jgi:hypothetical protein
MKLIQGILFYSYVFFLFSISTNAQVYSHYRPSISYHVYVPGINDSLHLELFIPREAELAPARPYPVIYLFDSQNRNNYQYNLQTIDYLTGFGNMPPAVLVGVAFPAGVRTPWTIPSSQKGKADSLLTYLLGPFREKLSSYCQLTDFNLLIGHSRTAMLSSYALAAFPGKVNAVIASSNSFFDFNNQEQQKLFEAYIDQKRKSPGLPRHFYFSSGTIANGDVHDTSVSKLNRYMTAQQFPAEFHWTYYQEKTPHITVPGMTTGRALNDLFSPVTEALQNCFSVVNSQVQNDSVPWTAYLNAYQAAADVIGMKLQPDLTFYNSLASAYMNDYHGRFKEKRFALAESVLSKGIAAYPGYPGLYSYLAAVKLESGDRTAARKFLQQAVQCLKKLRFANQDMLREEKASVAELLQELK